MNSVYRIIATAGAAAAVTLVAAGVAAAEDAEPPSSPLVEYIESWPPAPEWCNARWDPIENAVEDSIPPRYEPEFDAFDDWCEGDAD